MSSTNRNKNHTAACVYMTIISSGLEECLSVQLKRKMKKNNIFQSWLNPPSVGMPRPVVPGMLDMEGLSGATPK